MLRFTVSMPGLAIDSGWAARAIERFEREGQGLLVEAVQGILGTPDIYTLTPRYRARKLAGRTRPLMRPFPGKAPDQPLILTGTGIYLALHARAETESIVIYVDPSQSTMPRGFDVAAYWESGEGSNAGFGGTHYLEKGFEAARPALEALLVRCLTEELGRL